MQSTIYGKVLVLIDWDNLFLCLQDKFGAEINLEHRIQKLMEWIQNEIGEILEGYGFVFAPDHLNSLHREMLIRNNLRIIISPKEQIDGLQRDTVDKTLMWFGRMMLRHSDIGFICLVSGDEDFVPFMKEAKKYGIKIALAAPTINSLSRNLLDCIDIHPETGRKIILRLDTLLENV